MREASGPWESLNARIDHVAKIWAQCLSTCGGPDLFGSQPCTADAI